MTLRTGPFLNQHAGRALDARLHLLDRQLLDADGDPVGIVDDLELTGVQPDQAIAPGAPAPSVTALLSGEVVATRIFGGAPPASHLQYIPWSLVSSVGVTVRLAPTDIPSDVHWVERWLRDHIIARIPGGRHAAK